jgi:nucleoside-diphosphate-sugar epimerase
MASILIAGCGYVGCALGVELAARGDEVFGLRRDPSGLPPSIRPVAANLLDEEALSARIPPGLDAVVYAASASGFSDAEYRAAYVDGPRNLLSALLRAGSRPSRILFTSSTGVYGGSEGRWVDEDTPPEPAAFNGSRVLEGEEVFRSGPFPSVSLRFGGIYGPGRASLVDRVRAGTPCPEAPTWSNRIHRDDCAGALVHLLDLPDPAPLYVGVDREPADLCEIMGWLAARLGVDPPPTGGGGSRRGRNRRCSSARLVAAGYTFRFPTYREGFAPLLDRG